MWVFIVLAVIAAVFLLGLIIGNIFFNIALNPKANKDIVLKADHNQMADEKEKGEDPFKKAYNEGVEWFKTVESKDLYITAKDGLRLHSVEIAAKTKSSLWCIFCHGYTGNYKDGLLIGEFFHEKGFNLLLPDARGHGKSEGNICMGWKERLDLLEWMKEITAKDESAQIVVYGVSMGAATVMMLSGEDLPKNVKALVEDCGYSSVWDVFIYQAKALFHLPAFPVVHFMSIVTKIRSGFWLGEASALEQVKKSKTPTLFIHGDSDTFVPSEMLEPLFNAAGCKKEKLLIKDASHAMAQFKDKEKYWNTVFSFINNNLDFS